MLIINSQENQQRFARLSSAFKNFGKFIVSSLGAFIVDISVFSLMMVYLPANSSHQILIATIVARIISSTFNYLMNRYVVFQAKRSGSQSAIKYYSLVVIQGLASARLVEWMNELLPVYISLVKIVVDTGLFLISFQLQRNFIFKNQATS